MNIKLILGILLISLCSCKEEKRFFKAENHDYLKLDLVENDSTFWIEKGGNHYQDNYIYNNCTELTFEYNYEKNGEIKFFETEEMREWKFVSKDSIINGRAIAKIRLSSLNPNPEHDYSPQSSILYEYLNSQGKVQLSSHTGVVENHKNILIHNARGGFFWKLFSFPWPSVKFPVEVGKKWNWKWKYNGNSFGDDRFTNWEGIIQMDYEYKIIGKEVIDLDFGNVECYKIKATGRHQEIENQLEYYFNPKLGFVKFIFKTNDGATINLFATDYKDRCDTNEN